MESDCRNGTENIYFACRKKAAQYNETLSSREMAAEQLGISTSSLANHELGITKNVPVDTVVMMADLYHAPELRNHYCKCECPIGKMLPMATKVGGLQSITVRLVNSFDDDVVRDMKKGLLRIAEDGSVSDAEKAELNGIVRFMDTIATEISELRMLEEKMKN